MGQCYVVCLSDVGVFYLREVKYASYEERYEALKGVSPHNVFESAQDALDKIYWLNVH